MDIRRTLRRVEGLPNGWVRVERLDRLEDGMRLTVSVCKGRRGKVLQRFSVLCRDVREAQIDDLDGGGMAHWRRHPAIQQHTDPRDSVTYSGPQTRAVLGALFEVHSRAVSDWIPFERHVELLPATGRRSATLRCRGPRFLVALYAKTLREADLSFRAHRAKSRPRRAALEMLHFGNSYIVARTFETQALDVVSR